MSVPRTRVTRIMSQAESADGDEAGDLPMQADQDLETSAENPLASPPRRGTVAKSNSVGSDGAGARASYNMFAELGPHGSGSAVGESPVSPSESAGEGTPTKAGKPKKVKAVPPTDEEEIWNVHVARRKLIGTMETGFEEQARKTKRTFSLWSMLKRNVRAAHTLNILDDLNEAKDEERYLEEGVARLEKQAMNKEIATMASPERLKTLEKIGRVISPTWFSRNKGNSTDSLGDVERRRTMNSTYSTADTRSYYGNNTLLSSMGDNSTVNKYPRYGKGNPAPQSVTKNWGTLKTEDHQNFDGFTKEQKLAYTLQRQQKKNTAQFSIFRYFAKIMMAWYLVATAIMVYSGYEYFSGVVPFASNIYVSYGATARIEAAFCRYAETQLFDTVEFFNSALQLGTWTDPLHTSRLQQLVTPFLAARPYLAMVQLGFQGDGIPDIVQSGLWLRRVGELKHTLVQSDLYPSCLSIGIFGCIPPQQIHKQDWHKQLTNIFLGNSIIRTKLDPIFSDYEEPAISPGVQVESGTPPTEDSHSADDSASNGGGAGAASGASCPAQTCDCDSNNSAANSTTNGTTEDPSDANATETLDSSPIPYHISVEIPGCAIAAPTYQATPFMNIQFTNGSSQTITGISTVPPPPITDATTQPLNRFQRYKLQQAVAQQTSQLAAGGPPLGPPPSCYAGTARPASWSDGDTAERQRLYLLEQDWQKQIFTMWHEPMSEFISQDNVQITSENAMSAHEYDASVALLFKLRYPEIVRPDSEIANFFLQKQKITHLLGKLSLSLRGFKIEELLDPYLAEGDFKGYIVGHDGAVLRGKEVEEQLVPIPNPKTSTLSLMDPLKGRVRFLKIWEVEGFEDVTQEDLSASGEDLRRVGQKIHLRKINLKGRANPDDGRAIWVAVYSNPTGLTSSTSALLYACVMGLGLVPYLSFLTFIILFSLRTKAVTTRQRFRESALAESKKVLGAVDAFTGTGPNK